MSIKRTGPILSSRLITALLSGLLLLSGCGYYRGYQAKGKIEAVNQQLEENSAQLRRYLNSDYTVLTGKLDKARSILETEQDGQAALDQAQQVETTLQALLIPGGPLEQEKQSLDGECTKLAALDQGVQQTFQRIEQQQETLGVAQVQQAQQAATTFADQAREATTGILDATKLIATQTTGDQALQQLRAMLSQALEAPAKILQASIIAEATQLEQMEWSRYIAKASEEQLMIAVAAFQQLMSAGRFTEAVDLAQPLPEQGQPLLKQLQDLQARLRIARVVVTNEQVLQRITRARDMNAGAWAAQPLERAIEGIERSRALAAADKYDEAFEKSTAALLAIEEVETVLRANAQAQVDQLRTLFVLAREIGVDAAQPGPFEEISRQLSEASVALAENAYSTATQLVAQASPVLLTAYNDRRTELARQELTARTQAVDELDAEAAGRYVSELFLAARSRLATAEQELRELQFEPVAQSLQAVDQLVEDMRGDLARQGAQAVQQADQLAGEAQAAGAVEFAGALYRDATMQLEQARAAMAARRYRATLEAAEQAARQAGAARDTAWELQAELAQDEARAAIELAQAAGAAGYSPQEFNQALEQQTLSRQALAEARFQPSLEQARAAVRLADTGRLRLIEEAAALSRQATTEQGMEYAPALTDTAFEQLAQARRAMETGEFEQSRQQALAAAATARQALETTWHQRSENLLNEQQTRLQWAVDNQAPRYTLEEYRVARQALADASAQFAISDYRDAYDLGMGARVAIDQLQTALTQEADTQLQDFRRRIGEFREYSMDSWGEQRVVAAVERLAAMDQATETANYAQVFDAYRADLPWLQDQLNDLRTHNIEVWKQEARDLMAQADQAGTTLFLPQVRRQAGEELDRIVYDPLQDQLDTQDTYPDKLLALRGLIRGIQDWPNQAQQQVGQRLEQLRNGLEGLRGDNAQELAAGEYSLAMDSYELILGAQVAGRPVSGDSHALARNLAMAEQDYQLLADTTRLRLAERKYLERVATYLSDMNSLLNRFESVTKYGEELLATSRTATDVDMYQTLQREGLSTRELLDKAETLRTYLDETTPPPAYENFHQDAIQVFQLFVVVADLFDRFGHYELESQMREQWLGNAFDYLSRLHDYQRRLASALLQEGRRFDLRLTEMMGLTQREGQALKVGRQLGFEDMQ